MGFHATRSLWENAQPRLHSWLPQRSDTGVFSHKLSAPRDVNSLVCGPGMLLPPEKASSRELQVVLTWKAKVCTEMGSAEGHGQGADKMAALMTRSSGTSQDPKQGPAYSQEAQRD